MMTTTLRPPLYSPGLAAIASLAAPSASPMLTPMRLIKTTASRFACTAALLAAGLCVCTPSRAQSAALPGDVRVSNAPAGESPKPSPGMATRKWTKAQAQHEQATRNRPTLSGPVMTSIHERYVESFRNKIEPTSLHDRRSVKDN
jgi:Protein of unknown function (DUF3613)